MKLERESPCKVNLLLNILRRRADGFHELETVMHPVSLCDTLVFSEASSGVRLTCSEPCLPVDRGNLVFRAAELFLAQTGIRQGIQLHLEKRLPLAAGLGGGSGNAATTLLGLNEMFGRPATEEQLFALAAQLGSDIPFFLQDQPALATGRGEHIEPLEPFPPLGGCAFLLIHPGFGISTAWAYQALANYPEALKGRPGRAKEFIAELRQAGVRAVQSEFYNSLEAPALTKYPILALYQEFLREQGAAAALMSGSGSTTFAIADSVIEAESLAEKFRGKFGDQSWTAVVPISA